MKITLALFAYRQERFIVDAVNSALGQSRQPDEIILSDDHSSDSTYDLMAEAASVYSGPAEVVLRRNTENLGIAEHFNTIMDVARGDIVVVCAGDDISLPERVNLSASHFVRHPKMTAMSLRQRQIDASGNVTREPGAASPKSLLPLSLERYLKGAVKHPSAASRVYRRDLHEAFGPLRKECPSEDTPMLMRALLMGEVRDFGEIGILYRRHSDNLSSAVSVMRMDSSEIHLQQQKDLQRACDLGLIDRNGLRRYERLLESFWARRELNEKIRDQRTIPSLTGIMKASSLPSLERFRMAGKLIRRRLRNWREAS